MSTVYSVVMSWMRTGSLVRAIEPKPPDGLTPALLGSAKPPDYPRG
ncbi:hypothetical protein [Amycolatopsis sp. NPDC059021]